MQTYVFMLNDNEINVIKDYFFKHLSSCSNPYILYVFKINEATLSIYKSHKAVLNGKMASSLICDIENILNRSLIEKKDYVEGIGSDEVGTGALFGPITVCACYVSKDMFIFLENLKVNDSKKLSDNDILKIAPILVEHLPYSLLILNNLKYNEVSKKHNMNEIKAILHNHAYNKLISKLGFTPNIFLDKFCSEENYYKYIQNEKSIVKNIIMEEKGESKYIEIAAASVIARYAFLMEINKMENDLGFKINLGAGFDADLSLNELISKKGIECLPQYVKMNFNNVKKYLENKKAILL